MPPRKRATPKRIPKARQLRRSRLSRRDVTRGEYNHIIDVLNERNVILNGLRAAIDELRRVADVQFKRIAQIQADLDDVKRAWEETSKK